MYVVVEYYVHIWILNKSMHTIVQTPLSHIFCDYAEILGIHDCTHKENDVWVSQFPKQMPNG